MTDTITESFCERCGTRYSFEKAAKRGRGGIGRVRVATRGLKNFVANDGMPMAQAMAVARDDEGRAAISRQLEAFHKTFNFCMTCRQYTCANCWNEKAGECLTCSPSLVQEVLPAAFPNLPITGPVASGNGKADADAMVWPRVDLDRAAEASAAIEAEEIPSPEPPTGPVIEEPDVLARLDMFVAAPAKSGVDELTAAELAEIESALAATHPAAEPEPEPVVAAEPVVEAIAEPEPEPVVAAEPGA